MTKALTAGGILLTTLLAPLPAQAVIPSGNLIVNPGAEAGQGATDASTAVPVPGWAKLTSNGTNFVTGGNFTAVAYGAAGGFPTVATSTAIGGGANFFAGVRVKQPR